MENNQNLHSTHLPANFFFKEGFTSKTWTSEIDFFLKLLVITKR